MRTSALRMASSIARGTMRGKKPIVDPPERVSMGQNAALGAVRAATFRQESVRNPTGKDQPGSREGTWGHLRVRARIGCRRNAIHALPLRVERRRVEVHLNPFQVTARLAAGRRVRALLARARQLR